jgi:hypothetical protein
MYKKVDRAIQRVFYETIERGIQDSRERYKRVERGVQESRKEVYKTVDRFQHLPRVGALCVVLLLCCIAQKM